MCLQRSLFQCSEKQTMTAKRAGEEEDDDDDDDEEKGETTERRTYFFLFFFLVEFSDAKQRSNCSTG